MPKYQYIQCIQWRQAAFKKDMLIVMCCICLFLSLTGMSVSLFAYPTLHARYQQDLRAAYKGAYDLQMAIVPLQTLMHDPFNSQLIDNAQNHFMDALIALRGVTNDFTLLPDGVALIPVYGKSLYRDKELVTTAIETAQIGWASCIILHTLAAHFRDPLRKTQGFTMSDLNIMQENSKQIKVLLGSVSLQVEHLQAEDVKSPLLDTMVHDLITHLPLLCEISQRFDTILSAAPLLLGITDPSHYLIELLDTSEMRPGGGLIGNYGIATISGGRLLSAYVMDSYLLDNSKTDHIPIAPAYSWFTMARNWSLHDSNLDADFPTSARNAESLYRQEHGGYQLQGVIAVTPALLERILVFTGPIVVPEYHDIVTSQNLIERIHYHQLIEEGQSKDIPSPDGYSSLRKHFTALLSEAFLLRVRTLPDSTLYKLFPIMIDALGTKDIQIYFNSAPAENILHEYHLDGSIEPSSLDNLLAVRTNISPSKIDQDLITTINDQINIDSTGTAVHDTLINFTWTTRHLKQSDVYGPLRYTSYFRVYLPSNGILLTPPNWQAKDIGTAFGRKFWGGYYAVDYPSTGSLKFRWVVKGAAHKEEHIWHYLYQIQRQAGTQQNIHVHITLPQCAQIVDTNARDAIRSARMIDVVQPLRYEKEVSVSFACA